MGFQTQPSLLRGELSTGASQGLGEFLRAVRYMSVSPCFSAHLALLPGRASLSSLVSALGWEKGLEEKKGRGLTLELE